MRKSIEMEQSEEKSGGMVADHILSMHVKFHECGFEIY